MHTRKSRAEWTWLWMRHVWLATGHALIACGWELWFSCGCCGKTHISHGRAMQQCWLHSSFPHRPSVPCLAALGSPQRSWPLTQLCGRCFLSAVAAPCTTGSEGAWPFPVWWFSTVWCALQRSSLCPRIQLLLWLVRAIGRVPCCWLGEGSLARHTPISGQVCPQL